MLSSFPATLLQSRHNGMPPCQALLFHPLFKCTTYFAISHTVSTVAPPSMSKVSRISSALARICGLICNRIRDCPYFPSRTVSYKVPSGCKDWFHRYTGPSFPDMVFRSGQYWCSGIFCVPGLPGTTRRFPLPRAISAFYNTGDNGMTFSCTLRSATISPTAQAYSSPSHFGVSVFA